MHTGRMESGSLTLHLRKIFPAWRMYIRLLFAYYMIPVPDKCLHLFDFKNDAESHEHRIFIEKEYRFCKSKLSAIQKLATRTYHRVISKVDDELVRNSCDFKLLEQAYDEFTPI